MDVCELERFLPALNALGKALFTARDREEPIWSRALTISRLRKLGLTRADCGDLFDRGLVNTRGKNGDSRRIVLADAGLVVLQASIPLGAIRPMYDPASHRLTVAGHLILKPAVHGHNLSAVLTNFENANWPRCVEKPLAGRRCASDPRSLQVALSTLSNQQRFIELHAQGGAATWNWRPEGKRKH